MNKEEPKVLTRMILSCCWGDILNEKELNEIVDYIDSLQQENKQLKERIDETIDKLYCWGEILKPEFQKEMIEILKGE